MPFLISDGWVEHDLVLPQAESLSEAGVEVRAGETVDSIRREDGKIRLKSSSGRGTSLAFDSAVVCTGATSRGASAQGPLKAERLRPEGARGLPQALGGVGLAERGRRLRPHPSRPEARGGPGDEGEARAGLLREGRPRAAVLRAPSPLRYDAASLPGRMRSASSSWTAPSTRSWGSRGRRP